MLYDLKNAFRLLVKKPGFRIVAIATLALGVGGTTAIFNVVNGVLLRSLPYHEPDRILFVQEYNPELEVPARWTSSLNFRDFRERNQVFQSMVAWRWSTFSLTGGDNPERLSGYLVSAGFFPLLGVNPVLGRGFLEEEDQPGGAKAVVISHRFWQRRFGGDPKTVGLALEVDGAPHTIVGIAPEGFAYPDEVDLWSTFGFDYSRPRNLRYLRVLGRLEPTVTLAQARADLKRIAVELEDEFPDTNKGWSIVAEPLRDSVVKTIRPALLMLFGAVGLLLLIAAVNVANLLLAHSTTRDREVSIRQALGADRLRVVRQFLIESLVLSLVGGVLGLILSLWGTEALITLFAGDIPRAHEVGVDGWVLGFTFFISIATGLLFGIIPAFRASGRSIIEPLKGVGSSLAHSAWNAHAREILVATEVALALVLLVGASLVMRSFFNLLEADPGFSQDRIITMEFSLNRTKYPEAEERIVFYRELVERARTIPGVVSAGTIFPMPLVRRATRVNFSIDGQPILPENERHESQLRLAGPGYFETMGIPLVRGRYLNEIDTEDSLSVAVINESFAKLFFPNGDAVGRRMTFDDDLTAEDVDWLTVVGIVGDVRYDRMEEEGGPEIYRTIFQAPFWGSTLVVRSQGDPAVLVGSLRAAAQTVDSDLPLFNIQTTRQIVSSSLGQQRFSMALLALFGATALTLAAIGVFGVLSVSVNQRIRDIGIRMALGAPRRHVLSRVLGQGMVPVLAGVVLGLGAASGLTRFLSHQVYGVSTTDPTIFAVVSVFLVLVAFLACILPARRAIQIDPTTVLRCE